MCLMGASSVVLLIVGSLEELDLGGSVPLSVGERSREELRRFFAAGEFGSSAQGLLLVRGFVASGTGAGAEGCDPRVRSRTFCFSRLASLRANRPGCGSVFETVSSAASSGGRSVDSGDWSAKSEGIRTPLEDLPFGSPVFIDR